jgi:hypothetical protein
MFKQYVLSLMVVAGLGCGESDVGNSDAGDDVNASSSGGQSTNGTNAPGSTGSGSSSGGSSSGGANTGPGNSTGSTNSGGTSSSSTGSGSGGSTTGPGPGATTGPIKVSGTVAGFKLISGLAYFDPVGRLGDQDPALKIVLTDWPITACDPQSILNIPDPSGKHIVACELYRYRTPGSAQALWVSEGNSLGFLNVPFDGGCTATLQSGDDDGGEQVVGTVSVTGFSDANDVRTTVQVQVNHQPRPYPSGVHVA